MQAAAPLPAGHPAGPSVWVVLPALMATHLAGMGAFLAAPVLAPAIAAETGLAPSLAGIHTALVYAGALVSGPFAQPLLRRFGGIRTCQGALLVIAAGLALAALGQPLALVASALVAGLGHGPLTPAGSHILAARTPARVRSLVFGVKQCGVPAGAMLVAVLAPAVAAGFGWRAGMLAVAALGVVFAVALQPFRAALDDDRGGPGPPARPWHEAAASLGLLRGRSALRGAILAACALGVGQFTFFSFFVVWQVAVLGTPLAEAGALLAAGQAAGIAGRVGWALAADRIGARPVVVLIALGAALGLALLGLAGPGWPGAAVFGLAVLLGATAVGWNGVLLAEIARLAPPGRVGAATGAMGFAFALTQIVAPTLFAGLVGATGSYTPGFLLAALVSAGALAAVAGARVVPISRT